MQMKEDILQETEEQQLRWRGHVMWMEDCRIARQVAECNPQGRRRCGRRVNIWKDGIMERMKRKKPQGWRIFRLWDLEGGEKSLGWGKICIHRKIYMDVVVFIALMTMTKPCTSSSCTAEYFYTYTNWHQQLLETKYLDSQNFCWRAIFLFPLPCPPRRLQPYFHEEWWRISFFLRAVPQSRTWRES